ncbi:hypothetical protein NX059_002710 [Plenodomus lindquistii]|nr:hypothetical protein NX059_002710 [Plenodomus lindquistii]
MLSLIILALGALAQCAPTTLHTRATLDQDLKVLQAFAKTVDSPSNITANWTTAGTDLCAWSGVVCDDKHTTVIGLNFNQDKLTGSSLSLTDLIDKLPTLTFFHANSNNFAGTIPSLRNLNNLLELDVSNNTLSGAFPTAIFTAPNLEFIDLRFNQFTSSLPAEIFTSFPNADVLFLNNNAFTGSLPSEISSYPGRYLSLANNKFYGPIPSSITQMKNLNEILLLGNELTGSLPSGLGKLDQLTVFDVSGNQLEGRVPEELCAIESLQVLGLKGNRFEGELGPRCEEARRKGVLEI